MILRCTFRAREALRVAAYCPTGCRRRYASTTVATQDSDERLRILFCGSEAFSISSLKALSDYARSPQSSIESIDVVTRKDKHVGRGLKILKPPPIKSVAEELQLPLHQIDTFTGWNPPSYDQDSKSPTTNLIIAVSFGLLVPPRILRGAAYGGLNVHPSLLPQFKGAAPIQWTILHGLETTGVSLQTLHESKFDEGTVLDRVSVPIENPSTCSFVDLRAQLGSVGAQLLVKGLSEKRYASRKSVIMDSKPGHTSYAPKIKKQHTAIEPQIHGAHQILRMQRAFGPLWAYAHDINGKAVRTIMSEIVEANKPLPNHPAYLPDFIRATTNAIPVGVPFGILPLGKAPQHAGEAPLLLNTIDGQLAIHSLTVSGASTGYALVSALKGRLMEHFADSKSPSGEMWDVFTFYHPIRGEANGLPAIMLESSETTT